jgi:hypothetical protein
METRYQARWAHLKCLTCGKLTDMEEAKVCESCVAIPVKRCFRCRKFFDHKRRRCWLIETIDPQGYGDPKVYQMKYAYHSVSFPPTAGSIWSEERRRKLDPTSWKSTGSGSERGRILPFCVSCALGMEDMLRWDTYENVQGEKDLLIN